MTEKSGYEKSCLFIVIVVSCPAQAYFYTTSLMPSPNGMNVGSAESYIIFPSGIIIRNWCERAFTQSTMPPSPGKPITHSFSSQVEMEISIDGGSTCQPVTAGAANVVRLT